VILALWVDDSYILCDDVELFKKIKAAMASQYDLKDLGFLEFSLGLRIRQDLEAGTVTIDQEEYIDVILEEFGMTNCNPVSTPTNGEVLTKAMCPQTPEEKAEHADMKVRYGRGVGMILYVQRQTHPEISYAVRELCKYTSNPGPKMWTAFLRVLRFLKVHKTLCIKYTKPTAASSTVQLSAFCDSDFANDVVSRRSVTGWVTFLLGGPISWRCEGQDKTALSTAEAEYIAACEAAREVKHLVNLLEDLEESQGPVPLFEDNESCISWTKGRGKLEKRKHIDIKYHFIQDCVEDQLIEMKSIASTDQAADILTKGLAKEQFNHQLGMLLCRL
jgi:hypothetical protein